MTSLPYDPTRHTPDQEPARAAWAARNRRILADRTRWPDGVLATCERLEKEHPGWYVGWLPDNPPTGDVAGYCATRWRDDEQVFGADVGAVGQAMKTAAPAYEFGPLTSIS